MPHPPLLALSQLLERATKKHLTTESVVKPSRAMVASCDAPDTQLKCCFSPDRNYLMSVGHDGDIHIWSYPGCLLLTTLDAHAGPIYDCCWSSHMNGALVATASHDSTVILWDFGDPLKPTVLQHLYGHTDCVRSCTFDYTGTKVVTASYDKTAKVWDCDTGLESVCYEGHHGLLRVIATHPSRGVAASAGDDREVHLWQIEDGAVLQCIKSHTDVVFGLQFSDSGEHICTGSFDDTAKIFFWEEGYLEAEFGNDHTKQIYAADFTNRGRVVLCAESRVGGVQMFVITIWEFDGALPSYSASERQQMKSGELKENRLGMKCVGKLVGHTKQVYCCDCSIVNHNAMAVTASLDMTIKVWDLDIALEEGMGDIKEDPDAERRRKEEDRRRREAEMKRKTESEAERRRKMEQDAQAAKRAADEEARRQRERDEANRYAQEERMRANMEREMQEKMKKALADQEATLRQEAKVTSREAQKLLDQLEAAKKREDGFNKELATMGYAINNVSSWVFDTDANGKLQSVNATMLRSLGLTEDEVHGLSLRQALETAKTIDDLDFVKEVLLPLLLCRIV